MKQALLLSDGDYLVFFTKLAGGFPVSGFLMLLSIFLLGMAIWKKPWAETE